MADHHVLLVGSRDRCPAELTSMIERDSKNRIGAEATRAVQEALTLLAEGLPVAALARRMYMSESTAKTHISKLYEKLGAANRAQALMTAVRLGLVERQ